MNTSLENLFRNLSAVNFAEKDAAIIESEVIARFEKKLNRKLHDGDPWRQVLLAFAYFLSLLRSNIDFAGKQNLLRFASEGFLEQLGVLLGVERLEETYASTTLEFTLSTTLGTPAHIPAGTRATPGGNISFATSADLVIPPGELLGRVSAICMTAGALGNGFAPGTVNMLIDPFPFNSTVQNIKTTSGGANVEDIEALRERIHLAPESFSVAGPAGAYEFWAKTANSLIVDVSVESPNPGEVEIVPLLRYGEIPSPSILTEVYQKCSDRTRRPLTDHVIVRAPVIKKYDIKLKYWISRNRAAEEQAIKKRFNEGVGEFEIWQKSVLGRDINPSQLTKMTMKAGIKRIEVYEPAHTVLKHFEIGVLDIKELDYGGLEDD